jgi:hypothetical protein
VVLNLFISGTEQFVVLPSYNKTEKHDTPQGVSWHHLFKAELALKGL